jgi:hypothetical protein
MCKTSQRKTLGTFIKMEFVQETVNYNKKLLKERQELLRLTEYLDSLRAKNRKPLPKRNDSPNWQAHYVDCQPADTADFAAKKRGRKPKDLANELLKLDYQDRTFQCPGCMRTLPITKKYARYQCQTCYKRDKKPRKDSMLDIEEFQ